MAVDKTRIQQYLKTFNFKTLFIEELGWDHLKEPPFTIPIDGQSYHLQPLVEKRGVKVYTCTSQAGSGHIPEERTLRQIDREVTRHAYEHILIYLDTARENQVWQWVKREPGKPLAPRINRWHKGQSGEPLAQKLLGLSFDIQEESHIHTALVAGRVQKAFDVERVTKKFYDRFKVEHGVFLKFITGITAQTDREWYASLMLNRLMFVYFIQKKGFLDTQKPGALDGDTNYLPNRLKKMREEHSSDTFYSFYRYFLLKLFHEGLSTREHSPNLEKLLGKVPYLNGGLFDVHILERDNPDISIPDEAFERIFTFFDEFDWYLDDRPLKNDKEINPDVLGYIFEKYINQKQMGAYYTKEDITEYISKNTIIPYLFDAAEQKCLIAFEPDGPVWSLLRHNPDRYIYDAVKKSCELPLPTNIEIGLHDVSQRSEWNKAAPDNYALPTEIWREVVARRIRYQEIRAKLAAGEVTSIHDLITYNLDMRKFAEDVINSCDDSNLLRAFYDSIEQVTVLDPTCGSGAFLFAALAILEPLYEACLNQMHLMVQERDLLDAPLPPEQRRPRPHLNRFRDILSQAAKHSSRRYFILKSIIIHNLYGVDIMEEATEICKLHLFLKLVSQVEKFDDIEPLPDIDFNIRAGNTLVGFATYAEAARAISSKFDFDNTLQRIEQKAQEVERSFEHFRSLQTQIQIEPAAMAAMKQQIRSQLHALNAELDRYLASEYGIDHNSLPKKEEYEEKFEHWRQSHQPFHWFIEFYGIMKDGGFDVIIGNPPYVEYSKVKKDYAILGYQTESCGNLYAFAVERVIGLLHKVGEVGVIIPVASVCTDGYLPLQKLLRHVGSLAVSNFNDRPGKLFDGLEHIRLSIILCKKAESASNYVFTTKYNKWQTIERSNLFTRMSYTDTSDFVIDGSIPKLQSELERSVLQKVLAQVKTLIHYVQKTSEHSIYYTRKLSGFVQILDFVPLIYDAKGCERKPSELKSVSFASKEIRDIFLALLNSNLFYWLLTIYSDCRNLNKREIYSVPFDVESACAETVTLLSNLAQQLMEDFKHHSKMLEMKYENMGKMTIQCIYPKLSKPIIDEIDRVLAKHYGFTDEELDFIINYDIKYRMGRDSSEESEE